MKREDSILEWLLVQKDPSNEAIEEMEGEDLRTILKDADAVAVFVCKYLPVVYVCVFITDSRMRC